MLTKNFMYASMSKMLGLGIESYLTSIVAWNGDTIKTYTDYPYSNDYSNFDRNLYSLMSNHTKVSQDNICSNKYIDSSDGYFNKYGVCFGNGTNPPTENDSCMGGKLLVNYGVSHTYNVKKDSITFVYTITNNETDPFTISEIGLLSNVNLKHNNYYRYYSSGVLMERTLLESPITIPAGGVGQVTYTVRMNCANGIVE